MINVVLRRIFMVVLSICVGKNKGKTQEAYMLQMGHQGYGDGQGEAQGPTLGTQSRGPKYLDEYVFILMIWGFI